MPDIQKNEWEILIPKPTPSLNAYAYSYGPWQHRTAKQEWWFLIRSSPGFVGIPCAKSKRKLIVERYGIKKLDHDNLIGGLKMVVIDNLIQHKMLVDDSDTWLELEAKNCLLPKGQKPYTRLLLQDIT